MTYLLKTSSFILISLTLLAAQPLNKEFFTQQIQTLFNEVTITYTPQIKVIDPPQKITKTLYDSKRSFSRKQTIEFSKDYCSLTIKTAHSSSTIKLNDIIDIILIKNKSPELAPDSYPVYIKTSTSPKKLIIYAKTKDKKTLKSLNYLSYLCRTQESTF